MHFCCEPLYWIHAKVEKLSRNDKLLNMTSALAATTSVVARTSADGHHQIFIVCPALLLYFPTANLPHLKKS